jgi:glutathione S-transferase
VPRTLYLSPNSPYARKIRIVLLEKRLPHALELVDLAARPPAFLAISPLAKVPVLVDEDGTTVFDSTVMSEYLEDRYPEPPMIGRTFAERLAQRELDELGDTIADHAVALRMANDAGEPKWIARAQTVLARALDAVVARIEAGSMPPFGVGAAAIASALTYLELRHGCALIEQRPSLVAWERETEQRPSVAESKPR